MTSGDKTFKIEDARIIFRNFAGRELMYNKEGDRNFCAILDDVVAKQMLEDGWNVKYLNPQEEGDTPTPYIQVKVNYKNRPPRIILITDTSRTQLKESQIDVLDWADIRTADFIARSYEWEVGGKSGIKAYLQSLFITIEEDELERKYQIHENPPDQL